ncbi:MAG: hypothetical protein ABI629_05240 [bacterium]
MFEIRPVTPSIGAEIVGLSLGETCDADTFAALDAAWTTTAMAPPANADWRREIRYATQAASGMRATR